MTIFTFIPEYIFKDNLKEIANPFCLRDENGYFYFMKPCFINDVSFQFIDYLYWNVED